MVYSIILFSFEYLWVFLQVILGNSTYRVYIPAISFTANGSRDQEKPEKSEEQVVAKVNDADFFD